VPLAVTIAAAFIFSLNGFLNVVLFGLTRPGLFIGRATENAPLTQSKVSSQLQPNDRRNASNFESSYVDGAMLPHDIKLAPRNALTDERPIELESAYDIGMAMGFTLAETETASHRLADERGHGSDCSSEYGEGPRTRGFM
jgi:hypothetical protein